MANHEDYISTSSVDGPRERDAGLLASTERDTLLANLSQVSLGKNAKIRE